MNEEHEAVLLDFCDALSAEGAAAAQAALATWGEELRWAPPQLIEGLVAAFEQLGLRSVASHNWDALLGLHAHLMRLATGAPATAAALERSWQGLLAATLSGAGLADDASSHAQLLSARHDWLPMLVCAAAAGGASSALLLEPQHEKGGSGAADGYSNPLVGLLYVHLFHSPTLPPAANAALAAAAAPTWHAGGVDAARAQHSVQAAMQAAVGLLQAPVVRARITDLRDPRAASDRVLAWLVLFRRGPPPVSDCWWGSWAAVVRGLAAAAELGGTAALRAPCLQPVLCVFCCAETAYALAPVLLTHPPYMDAKDGPRRALALAEALLGGDAPALVTACCELLRPEGNQPIGVRVEALRALSRAADRWLAAHDGDTQARLALWSPNSLAVLALILTRDPSIRVRREGMRLLSSVSIWAGDEQELLALVALKCRDRDDIVRQEAFAMLAQFPTAALVSGLDTRTWQDLLDLALAPASAGAGATAGPTKQGLAIQATARQLLRRYVLGGGTRGEEDQQGGCQGEEEQVESAQRAALARLAAVRPPAGWLAPGQPGQHLAEAWAEALQEVLLPAAAGIGSEHM
eukprot:scaffold12.g8093.t1